MKSLNATTQLIRDEHKKLRGLFRQLEVLRSRSPDMVKSVLEETCAETQVYLELEEKLLFPEVHRTLKEKTHLETPETEFIHEALSEHREIVEEIRSLRALLSGAQPRPTLISEWDIRIRDFVSVTEAYLVGEEKQLLPFVERCLPRVDASLSMRWFDLTDEVRARIHATVPSDPNHAQNPNGGEQKRIRA